jgi:multiple sugar transport system substrate-binding protein
MKTIINRWGSKVLSGVFALGVIFSGFTATEANAWSLEEAAAPYKGQEIKVICEGYPACFAMKEMSPQFTEMTGISVTFEIGDMLNISQRVMTDMLTKSSFFDSAQIHHTQLALFAEQGWATPLSTFLDNPKLKDPSLNMGNFIEKNMDFCCEYNGELLAMPWYYIPLFPVLRQDYLSDAGERAAFKAKYGYELPDGELITHISTWQQWKDMAEFFTRKTGDKLLGKVLDRDVYGIGMPFQRHYAAASVFWSLLTAHEGQIVDADGKLALDKGTAAIDALNFMLEMTKYAPPGWAEYNWDNQYTDFCNGTIFSTPSWADTAFYLEEAADCVSATNVSYTPLPAGTKSFPSTGTLIVPSTAPNPEASFLFMQWFASDEIQIIAAPKGWIPNSKSVARLDWSDNQNLHGSMEIHKYLEDNNLLASVPQHPSMVAIMDVLMEELSGAGAGEISSEEAVQNMVARIGKILK